MAEINNTYSKKIKNSYILQKVFSSKYSEAGYMRQVNVDENQYDFLNYPARKSIRKILGLPFAYNEFSDPYLYGYNESIMKDLPLVHIEPGEIKFNGSISTAIKNFVNGIGAIGEKIPFIGGIFALAFDERRAYFSNRYNNFNFYVNALVTFLFNKILSVETDLWVSNIDLYDIFASYSLGFKNLDEYKKFKNKTNEPKNESFSPEEIQEQIDAIEQEKKRLQEVFEKGIQDKQQDIKQNLQQIEKDPEQYKKDAENQGLKLQNEAEKFTIKDVELQNERRLSSRGYTFYMDASTSVSEDLSNSYGESQLSSEQASKAQEIRDLHYQSDVKGALGKIEMIGSFAKNLITNTQQTISDAVSKLKQLTVVSSSALIHGALISLPEVWNSSSFSRNYRISFKFNTPYGDIFSVLVNVYLPMLILMAMGMPRRVGPSEYIAPFVVKVDAPGHFTLDLAAIESITVQRGGSESSWTVHSLPTSVEVQLSIKDLMPQLIGVDSIRGVFANRTLAYFLSNLSGCAVDDLNIVRTMRMMTLSATSNAMFYLNPKRIVSKIEGSVIRTFMDHLPLKFM